MKTRNRYFFSSLVIMLSLAAAILMFKMTSLVEIDEFSSKIEHLKKEVENVASSDLDRVKKLNAWIAISLGSVGEISPKDMEQSLDMMAGYCGHRDQLLVHVADQFNLKARRVSFFNIPMQLGHTATEVFIDNEWMFFDSSFGIYFTKKNDNRPIGLSIARSLYPAIDVHMVTQPLHRGKWALMEGIEYRKLNEKILNNPSDGLPMAVLERTYFASDVAGVNEENIYFSRLLIDLETHTEGKIGEADDSAMDLASGAYLQLNGATQYSPLLERIGEYGDIRVGREFVFSTSSDRYVRLSIKTLSSTGTPLVDLDHWSGAHDFQSNSVIKSVVDSEMKMEFYVKSPATSLKVWYANGHSEIDSYGYVVLPKSML